MQQFTVRLERVEREHESVSQADGCLNKHLPVIDHHRTPPSWTHSIWPIINSPKIVSPAHGLTLVLRVDATGSSQVKEGRKTSLSGQPQRHSHHSNGHAQQHDLGHYNSVNLRHKTVHAGTTYTL